MADAGDPPVSRAADEAAQVEQMRQRLENTPEDIAFLLSALAASQQARQQAEQARDEAQRAADCPMIQCPYEKRAEQAEARVKEFEQENGELRTLAKIGVWHNECRLNRHQAAQELQKSQAVIDKLADRIAELEASKAQAEARVRAVEQDRDALRQAIRDHRDTRGDDRCWRDDETLYAVLPEGYTPPARDTSVELDLCRRYIASRQHPQTVYVSPQREIERLAATLARLREALNRLSQWDVLDSAADGPYWRKEIAAALPEAEAPQEEQK